MISLFYSFYDGLVCSGGNFVVCASVCFLSLVLLFLI